MQASPSPASRFVVAVRSRASAGAPPTPPSSAARPERRPLRPAEAPAAESGRRSTSIVESGPLTEPHWTPKKPLQRGRDYAWQVETTAGELTPSARFRVAAQNAIDEIEEARRRHPEDALLHATILARHGFREEAVEALERLERSDGGLAKELRKSIQGW